MAVQETTSPAGVISVEENNGGQLTVPGILVGVIVRPRATFKSLRAMNKGYWWLAFLITIAALVLYTIVSAGVTSRAIQSFTPPAGAAAGAAGTNTFRATQASPLITIVVPLASGILMLLLGYAFRSLIAYGASLVLGGHSTFRQTFRMAVWTTIPGFFRHVVQSVAIATSSGRIISGLSGVMTTAETRALPVLNLLLQQIDVFALWSMVLLGIGIAVTTRLSKGKSTVAVLIYIVVAVAGLLLYYVVSNALGGLTGDQRTPGPGGFRGPGG